MMMLQWVAILVLSICTVACLGQNEVCPVCEEEHIQKKFCAAIYVVKIQIIQIKETTITGKIIETYKGNMEIEKEVEFTITETYRTCINISVDQIIIVSSYEDFILDICNHILKISEDLESAAETLRRLRNYLKKACRCSVTTTKPKKKNQCYLPPNQVPCYSTLAICVRKKCHCDWVYIDLSKPTCPK